MKKRKSVFAAYSFFDENRPIAYVSEPSQCMCNNAQLVMSCMPARTQTCAQTVSRTQQIRITTPKTCGRSCQCPFLMCVDDLLTEYSGKGNSSVRQRDTPIGGYYTCNILKLC